MLIDSEKAFDAFLERAATAPLVTLDTEFVWNSTYYPILGIVQAGFDDTALFLLDVPALGPAFRRFGAILENPACEKILHDAQQDLAILRRETGSNPVRVFDTRRAAGVVGCLSTLSLQNLARDLLGVELSKSETLTDWCRRPLTPKQLDYARDDIRHLPALRQTILDRARAAGHEAWIAEEMLPFDDAALYDESSPTLMFERVKGARDLRARSRAVLRELAAWREREARRQDRPRGHVIPDLVLSDIARRPPKTREALAQIEGAWWPNTPKAFSNVWPLRWIWRRRSVRRCRGRR